MIARVRLIYMDSFIFIVRDGVTFEAVVTYGRDIVFRAANIVYKSSVSKVPICSSDVTLRTYPGTDSGNINTFWSRVLRVFKGEKLANVTLVFKDIKQLRCSQYVCSGLSGHCKAGLL